MKENVPKILAFVAVIFIMLCAFVVNRQKAKITEASKLPFHNVDLAQVEDGVYVGKTYTSFAHLQLKVTVNKHKIEKIDIIECDGIEIVKSKNIVQKMIEQNKIVIPAAKGEEIGTIIFISCVDSALFSQQEDFNAQK